MKEEEWRLLAEFPRYSVSDKERLRHNKSGRILMGTLLKNGYLAMTFYANSQAYKRYVHRLVCETFNGAPPPGPLRFEVAHEDGTRTNNTATNLTWKTRTANSLDKIRHGTHQVGSIHVAAILNDAQIREIFERYSKGEPQKLIAKDLGVTRSAIASIIQGLHWQHIDSPYREIAKTRYSTHRYGAAV